MAEEKAPAMSKETDKALGEKFLAEARKADAEASKAMAEADSRSADAALTRNTLEDNAIKTREHLRAEQAELSHDTLHFVYHFDEEVSSTTVKDCMKKLNLWRRQYPEQKKYEIIFTSPGGEIISGFVLYDFIKMLIAEDIEVTTGTLGTAASMAGILLQAGSKRWMGKESWVLIHQAAFGTMGSYGKVEDTVDWVKRIQDRILDIFAARASDSPDMKSKEFKKSRAFIKKNWERKDWWLSSTECMKNNFVDEVK